MTGPGLLHQAFLYGSDDEFVSALVPFAQDGLRQGDHVVAVTSPAHIGLLRGGLDQDAAGVHFIEADSWYQAPVSALAAYDRYLAEHGTDGRIRLIAEAFWPVVGQPPVEWPRYEAVINVAFAGTAAWIVCPYDTRSAAPQAVVDARRTHPQLGTGLTAAPSQDYLTPLAFHQLAENAKLTAAPVAARWVDFGPPDLRVLRARVTGDAEVAGLPPERVAHMVCAVNEVATNAVQHGGGSGAIRCWIDDAGIVCEVASRAPFTTPFPGYLPPRRDNTSGRGLWLARQLCDLVEVRTDDGGTLVRLTMIR